VTLTGVLIGTTSIAVMMSIGVGMDRAFESQFSRMGSLNTITVTGYYYSDGGSDYYYSVSGGTGIKKDLTTRQSGILNRLKESKLLCRSLGHISSLYREGMWLV